MKKILLLIIFFVCTSFKEERESCLEMDLFLLIDVSGSVAGYESFINKAIYSFVRGLELSEETIKIGMITFSSDATLLQPLTSNKFELDKYVLSENGSTNLVKGFYLAVNELFSESGRSNAKKMLIVISDGAVDSSSETKLVSEQLRVSNIGICAVLVSSSTIDSDLMKAISSNCYAETDYNNLLKTLRELDICL